MSIFEYNNVSELNLAIKQKIDELSKNKIKVTGEVSNLKISNGNLFATLKDNESCLNVAFWGYNYKKEMVNNKLENGETITIKGKLTHYSKTGSLNFFVNSFEKIGKGNFHVQYEQLKQKYERMGYFSHKKKPPLAMSTLGIITSLDGAALQDILYVLKRNNFVGKIIIKNCIVQGSNAPSSIVNGIYSLENWIDEQSKPLDALIITRGGGSFEDLLGFSSPEVVNAIHNCKVFTISAVGHEIDFMLSDFVSDLRAPTPSVSGEMICTFKRNQNIEYNTLRDYVTDKMKQILLQKLNKHKTDLTAITYKCQTSSPGNKLNRSHEELDNTKNKIVDMMGKSIEKLKLKLKVCEDRLKTCDIKSMLKNGYMIAIRNNRIIDSVEDVKIGQKLKLETKDGQMVVTVNEIKVTR